MKAQTALRKEGKPCGARAEFVTREEHELRSKQGRRRGWGGGGAEFVARKGANPKNPIRADSSPN
ncbi:hypothetical protein TIFTF001_028438 [Ficus carica]|uniref:Uncharacterized protein n=1 Tax=Ficus carica TaxID=3494 RepID=A0AA88IWJ1_FICCA|nr:hypothetical protein TIFTF001_028438 [Ficus carica]